MKIGRYEIHSIETGRFWLDGGAMFGVVPWIFWSKTNPPDERQRIELVTRSLLLKGEGKTILIDNGNGNKWTEKIKDIYKLDTSRSDLFTSLSKYDVKQGDVTDVILTHLHFDHAGGSTMLLDGKLEITFPRARYYVQKKQWEQSQNTTEKDRASFMNQDFELLMERGVLDLVDGECELFSNIKILVCSGHTAAQQLPLISDGYTTLFYCCDLIPLTSHTQYPYIMGYDLRPLVTLEDKKRILPKAYEENWILFMEHDPIVEAFRLEKSAKGFNAGPPIKID